MGSKMWECQSYTVGEHVRYKSPIESIVYGGSSPALGKIKERIVYCDKSKPDGYREAFRILNISGGYVEEVGVDQITGREN